MAISPVRLNHAVLFVADLDRSVNFYTDVSPRDQWGPYENAAPIDHLDLAGEVERWSGVRTAGDIGPSAADAHP